MRKNREEIRNWLLENCVNENGDLDLTYLDFSNFDGNIYISCMKVKKDLIQSNQEVKANLFQSYQKVEGSLYQHTQKVEEDLWQSFQEVKGKRYE